MSATSRSSAGALVALAVTLVAPAGPASASAVSSATTVALSSTQSTYGQVVTATAAVSAQAGPAQGDVVFSVDGLAIKANLGASGTATVVLPAALVGPHDVVATFVPQFPEVQQGSASPTLTWTVAQVRTRLQVRVIGKGARIPTSVQVKAAGEYGSRPAGRVTIVVRRKAGGARFRVVQRLDRSAVVLADLGRLRKGAYRLETTYVGDSQHLRERRLETFRVRQR